MQRLLLCAVCAAGLASCGFPRPADVGDDASPSGDDTSPPIDAAIDTMDGDSPPQCSPTATFGAPSPILGIALTSDSVPRLSADELTIYFSAAATPNGMSDLYVARRSARSEPFGTPALIMELSPSSSSEGDPTVGRDGLTMFFDSTTPDSGQIFPNYQIYVATRPSALGQFGAAAPATVNGANPGSSSMSPFLTADGQELWLSTVRDAQSIYHIWRAVRVADGFSTPALVPELKAAGEDTWDTAPAVSFDKLSVYFSRLQTSSANGFDIWMSHRSFIGDGFPAPHRVDELNTAGPDLPGWILRTTAGCTV